MSHLMISADGKHMTCQCGSCSVSMHVWKAMTEHSQLAVIQLAQSCPTCKKREQEARAKLKLYSLEISVFATAYIKAKSPEEALKLAQARLVKNGLYVDENATMFDGRPYDKLMSHSIQDITVSPAMTVDHIHGEPEQVWPG